MTLSNLLQNLAPLDSLRSLWLVFPAQMGDALTAAQEGHTAIRVEPVTLTDGRLALCADLLTEIRQGGAYATAFANLNATTFASVEVLSTVEFIQLKPAPEEP